VYFIWALAYIPRHELILAWKSVILVKLKSMLSNVEEDFLEELESFIKYVCST
jgi:hypothetical protein